MQESFWTSITQFGDTAVGIPLAALVLTALAASGWLRGAMAWVLAAAGCGAVMAVLKITSRLASCGYGPDLPPPPVFSPSGHAALSAVMYGGLAVLGGRQMPPKSRLLLGLVAAAWIGLIASSRIELQAHTPIEVAVGLLVGLGAVALLILLLRRAGGPRELLPQLAIASLLGLCLMYGTVLAG